MKTIKLILILLIASQTNAQCWQTVSAGGDKSMALTASGKIWGWGDNSSGGLGLGSNSGPQLNPVQSSDAGTFTQIASGGNSFTIALKSDGTLWSTGNNAQGFLGIGNYLNKSTFTQIGTDTNWQSISAGGAHVLALKTNGTLWAWGANSEGQLGNGNTTLSNVPIQIGTDANWQSISAGGYYFSAAIKTDGTLWVWGNDSFGQLGNGVVTQHQNIPTQLGSSTDWQKVSCGQYHILVLKNNGSLWGWGDNSSGTIGIGSTTPAYSPVQIGTATDWQKISASTLASYAIKTDGTLWSWGYNSNGQLGDGTTIQKTLPIQVGTDANWQTISGSIGYYFAIGLKNDGSAWSWGINNFGVLGDGTNFQKLTPTAITCPALAVSNYQMLNTTIYPNPCSGIFYLETPENISQIKAFDTLGKLANIKQLTNNQFSINGNGVYFLKIEFESGQVSYKKLIVK